jgi:hypothetical protein
MPDWTAIGDVTGYNHSKFVSKIMERFDEPHH